MTKNNTAGLVILLIIIGASVFLWSQKNVDTMLRPPQTASIKGCYVANLAKDVYTLSVDEESNGNISGKLAYNNFEKDSSYGSLIGTYKDNILLGNYSFDSEGMHSNRQVIFKKVGADFVQGFGPVTVVGDTETFQDATKVTYDPKSTFKFVKDCLGTYVDQTGSVSFQYPLYFIVPGQNNIQVDFSQWRSYPNGYPGILLGYASSTAGYMSGTNLMDVNFTVGRSTDAKAIQNCVVPVANSSEVKGGTKTISGYPFTKLTSTDPAAGNIYATTSYRGIVDGDCYAIEYTIHFTNIGNYDPSAGITEFDQAKIQNELEKIVSSFKFLISSN